MRTTLNVDDKTMEDLMHLTSAATRTAAVNAALREWVQARRIAGIKSLRGKLRFDGDLAALESAEIREHEEVQGGKHRSRKR